MFFAFRGATGLQCPAHAEVVHFESATADWKYLVFNRKYIG